MAQTTRDLWPSNLVEAALPPPPLVLLQEQASLLAEKTQGTVEASVEKEVFGDRFIYQFVLKAPGLGGYEYTLFTVGHAIVSVYPARFVFGEHPTVAENEQEFTDAVATILSSERTKQVVNSLVSQVAS